MEADDVIAVAGASPGARLVAVHMESINDCLESRSALSRRLEQAGVDQRVDVPADGESLSS
jgi:hypothetical protein